MKHLIQLIALIVCTTLTHVAQAGSQSPTLATTCPTTDSLASLGAKVATVNTLTYPTIHVGIAVSSGTDTFRLMCRSYSSGYWWTIGDIETDASSNPHSLSRFTIGSVYQHCVICRVGGSVNPTKIEVIDAVKM